MRVLLRARDMDTSLKVRDVTGAALVVRQPGATLAMTAQGAVTVNFDSALNLKPDSGVAPPSPDWPLNVHRNPCLIFAFFLISAGRSPRPL
jgi:hypothetical protein